MKSFNFPHLHILFIVFLLTISSCQDSVQPSDISADQEIDFVYPELPDSRVLRETLKHQKERLSRISPPTTNAFIKVPNDFPTIQDAINAAAPNATIEIAAGDYYERLTLLTDGVKLIGKGVVYLHGGINIMSDEAEINRINIDIDTNIDAGFVHGIHVMDSEGVRIINNTVVGGLNSFFGIALDNSVNCLIRENAISGTIQGGILSLESTNNFMTANDAGSQAGGSGITLWESTSDQVINNKSNFNPGYGIIILGDTAGNTIMRNEFLNNGLCDILVCCSSAGGNAFVYNRIGCFVDGSL